MSSKVPTPKEVQAARAYLYSRHKLGFRISPRKFAAAAKELGVGFRELMRFIMRLYAKGQHGSEFRRAEISRQASTG